MLQIWFYTFGSKHERGIKKEESNLYGDLQMI